ncbi:universal stress protein [uncultured Piscinibacter sp.]|uniref:universal stress protein n=1 Tax=uncultured Piscinibacter sp. TaxID=1131835 RepID=UPI00260E8E6B|nr:universal stress protein [uncultured Piscinibacter sp.]
MMKVLIAIDGSDHARRAIDTAARLAQQGAAIDAVLLNVRESPAYYGELPPFDYASLDKALGERQASVLEAALTQARAAGLTTLATQAADGPPAREIARVAAERGVDCIVMGTRGMNALGGLLLGSVAQRVVHLATVPVMLVK